MVSPFRLIHTASMLMKVEAVRRMFSPHLIFYIKGDLYETRYDRAEYALERNTFCSVRFFTSNPMQLSYMGSYANPYISMHTWVVIMDLYWHTSEVLMNLNYR